MIALVVLWSNGMVMVFDEQGKQMARYQGIGSDKIKALLRDATPQTRYERGIWGQSMTPISREEFEAAVSEV